MLLKKTLKITLLCGALLASSVSSYAQNFSQRKQQESIIKMNVVGIFVGQYQFAYEKALNNKFSVQVSAGFINSRSSGSSTINGVESKYDNTRNGFIVIPECRFYPFSNEAPRGMYLAVFGRYRNVTNDLTDISEIKEGQNKNLSRVRTNSSIGGGAVLGYQWIGKGGFSFEIFAGPQYKSRTSTTEYDVAELNEQATNPTSYESLGDELFAKKYINFEVDDTAGMGIRFGFNFGFAF